MRRPSTLLVMSAALLSAVAASHCRSDGGIREGGAASPEELVTLLGAAEQEGRYGDLVDLMPSHQRDLVVFMTWFGAAYDSIGAAPEVVDAYRSILDEYSLDEAWLDRRPTPERGIPDIAAQALEGRDLADLYQRLAEFQRSLRPDEEMFGLHQAVQDLRVEGDRAEAIGESRRFTLVKVDGRWFWQFFPDDLSQGS